jgi:cyclic beta-1,2-glucan synthetase
MLVSLALLADQSWRMGDAIVRTLIRLLVTRRLLLEWTTAAQANDCARLSLGGFYRQMFGGILLALAVALLVGAVNPTLLPLALPFVFAWLAAPLLTLRISQPPPLPPQEQLSSAESDALRLTARRTWHYFETFVTSLDNMLPPDNFQEDPKPVIAHRTSPTNMGLYLLSCVAARDFGWASTSTIVVRLQATLATMEKLARYKGHFYNWYDTRDLRVLEPAYVSSVDSGNLAGHLIVLANACEEWREASTLECDSHIQRQGILDTLTLARTAIDNLPATHTEQRDYIAVLLTDIQHELEHTPNLRENPAKLLIACEKMERLTSELAVDDAEFGAALFWIESLNKLLQCAAGTTFSHTGTATEAHQQNHQLLEHQQHPQHQQLTAIAELARRLATEMNFVFLLDPERKLLSIGYSQLDNRLDPSCYDLLASEARLASLFAIAKGDADTKHWFHLGRAATPLGTGSALISWSGSMFEYLMPSLVMRAPRGSLLEQTNRLIVKRQQTYGATHKIPWGISESAYNARDMEFTYQYANFGVPGLGLKRGLAENLVVAPYATGLATMVDARAAVQNYARLAAMGALGRYGFFEALDFTAAHLPKGSTLAIVRNFMAHHQGMTIVAIANTLNDGSMRRRFHREPMIQACELLLQERLPRNVAIAHPRAEEVKTTPSEADQLLPSLRRFNGTTIIRSPRPITHLLSNGRYAVMLTASGAGYSRWRNIAITRWREDATRDDWGSFVFLRDTLSGNYWSACIQPQSSDSEYSDTNKITFGEDHAEFKRRDGSLTTSMEVLVSGEDDGEVRRLSLVNRGRRSREIELTSYAELVLTQVASDNAHQAFAKLFVQTEFLPEWGALIATRRPRAEGEPQIWAAHIAVIEGESVAELQYETDRARFFGSNRKLGTATGAGISDAAALLTAAPLSNTSGTVLDPIFSLRVCIKVAAGEVARVAFWTLVASSREALLDLIDKHHDRNAFERAKTLAWTQAQVQLRHLGVNAKAAADFQQLTAPILYNHADFRASSAVLMRGAGAQSGLWPHAISGDLPIVLLRIDDSEDMAQVRQLLLAHEYWRMKRLDVDLVIINERASSYVQDLHIAIETAVRSSQARPHFGAELGQGSVYVLRADLMTSSARALIQAVARVELIAHRGALAKQLALHHAPSSVERANPRPVFSFIKKEVVAAPDNTRAEHPLAASLEFFNGLGGFANNGREYVTILRNGERTPAPWINVIANPNFGFQVSAEGSGYTWADSSRENQLTPWSNDPVKDPSGEAIYVCDEATGAVFTATAGIRDGGEFVARHGRGYSRFEHEHAGIALDLLQYVPLTDPIKISRLTLHNHSDKPRRLTVTAYNDWVLGNARGASGPFISTEIDTASGALLAYNRWNSVFAERVAFADMSGMQQRWTADRSKFWGRTNATGIPAALHNKTAMSGTTGAGLDPCAALQCTVDLAAGETREVVIFLGQCLSVETARDVIARYRTTDLDAVLAEVIDHWDTLLGAVQVKTPDRAMDIMLNGWLLYQTLACRIWARSAFYQASGAYGFRDQLQDGMALTFSQPALTRSHLLRAASRQFVEGDVQHWWLPHTGQGVRTRISDDRVWLSFATATYILSSGDSAVLDEPVTFLSGQQLAPGEHDAFFQPMLADGSASLFEHCARGLDQCLELTGELGLPLMGTGDWNDGMNRVGQEGKGESVWLGWLLVRTIELFLPHAKTRDPQRAEAWRAHAIAVCAALENSAWDGDWYRRATFDDGTWLGSKNSDECRIDSIAQSWAVLSGAANPERAQTAMASVEKYLIQKEAGLALLFTPPFNHTALDPGYIKGYPPGLRENGGQYSHAAMWVMFAFAKLGQGDKAVELFSLLNPINHARTPAEAERYKVEPYAVAADVYSVAPHSGRGGWTWYTGAAGWMYRAGVEGILGIRREGKTLVINPCIPKDWPGFEAVITVANTRYQISVRNSEEQTSESTNALLDGLQLTLESDAVRVLLDGGSHTLEINIFCQ